MFYVNSNTLSYLPVEFNNSLGSSFSLGGIYPLSHIVLLMVVYFGCTQVFVESTTGSGTLKLSAGVSTVKGKNAPTGKLSYDKIPVGVPQILPLTV